MNIENQQRILHLPSGHNFRDIGGYRTDDGRTVKWRQIFRSGYMSKITDEDRDQLHRLGIDTICDFRANGERTERPTVWHEGTATQLWARDYELSAGALGDLMKEPHIQAAQSRASMLAVYRELPYEQADSYREMFDRIAAGRVPLVFNCSAGKDRTGVASALVLTLLGVPRGVVDEDYLLTNATIDDLFKFMAESKQYKAFVTDRREQIMPVMMAEKEYLDTSFDVIEREHGSVENYVRDILSLSDDAIEAIRVNLLD
jgi:protein-tyrosine phosphatase